MGKITQLNIDTIEHEVIMIDESLPLRFKLKDGWIDVYFSEDGFGISIHGQRPIVIDPKYANSIDCRLR